MNERFNPEAGFLDMDELPTSAHNIGVVFGRLLTEAKNLFGDSVSIYKTLEERERKEG